MNEDDSYFWRHRLEIVRSFSDECPNLLTNADLGPSNCSSSSALKCHRSSFDPHFPKMKAVFGLDGANVAVEAEQDLSICGVHFLLVFQNCFFLENFDYLAFEPNYSKSVFFLPNGPSSVHFRFSLVTQICFGGILANFSPTGPLIEQNVLGLKPFFSLIR